MEKEKLEKLARLIKNLNENTQAILEDSNAFPALKQNAKRILACVKMMEINLPPEILAGE